MQGNGKFIVLEGLDGSGKSTQAQLLKDKLASLCSKRKVFLTCEPSDSIPGVICRGTLKGNIQIEPETLSLMFAADRIEHIKKELLPQLTAGNHIVCDRFYYSNFAYQSLNGEIDVVVDYNKKSLELLKPDAVVFINLSAEDCQQRRHANRATEEMFENIASAKKVYNGYIEVFERFDDHNIIFVNSPPDADADAVATQIWLLLKDTIFTTEDLI